MQPSLVLYIDLHLIILWMIWLILKQQCHVNQHKAWHAHTASNGYSYSLLVSHLPSLDLMTCFSWKIWSFSVLEIYLISFCILLEPSDQFTNQKIITPHTLKCSTRSTPWPGFCACAMLRDCPRFWRETWLALYYAETTRLLSPPSRPSRKAKIFWISSIGRFTGCRGRGIEQRLEFIKLYSWKDFFLVHTILFLL